ncbi:response regulator [Pseudooceanicola algae]|nr:response regulator [Pseudooceanicola algae]
MNDPTLLNIILIEDDDGDAKAIRRAFSKARIANPIIRVTDGIEALALLRGESGTPPASYVILLDLNMPRMGGLEFLSRIRADPRLQKEIVFITTTSNDDRDKSEAYAHNVAGYILKTKAGTDFINLVGTLDHYWRIVELPTNPYLTEG